MYHRRRYSEFRLLYTIIIVSVMLLYKFIVNHPQAATFTALIILIPGAIIRHFLLENDYKNSLNGVRKVFIAGKNTLSNNNCTVKYVPDDRIIVMDNIPNSNNKKQMFTLVKRHGLNINKSWSNVCRTFDDVTTLGSLAFLLDVENSEIVMLDVKAKPVNSPSQAQINVNNSNIVPKEPKDTPPSKPTVQKQPPKKISPQNNLYDMSSVLQNTNEKIDINNAQAAELAILPGINIIIAKKLVEHRDTSGPYKTPEEFIETSGVKPHFVKQIKSMIICGNVNTVETDADEEGRIVDF